MFFSFLFLFGGGCARARHRWRTAPPGALCNGRSSLCLSLCAKEDRDLSWVCSSYPMTDRGVRHALTFFFCRDVIGDTPAYYVCMSLLLASQTSLLGAYCDTSPDNPGQARRGIVFAHEAGRETQREERTTQQQQHRRFAFRHVQRPSHRTEAARERVPIKHVSLSLVLETTPMRWKCEARRGEDTPRTGSCHLLSRRSRYSRAELLGDV